MFTCKKTVHLGDTDMTGVIYFADLLKFAGEAFELFLFNKQIFIEQKEFFLPVVHAEADFKAPIKMADVLTIELSVQAIGNTSFTIESKMVNEKGILVGTTKIVHVVTSREVETSIPIPQMLCELLSAPAL